MSVLVKGMEMPSGCYTCPIIYSEDGAFDFECPFTSYFHWHNAEYVINYIPDSCLLVEVPTPHGRLIDADKLVWFIDNHIASGKKWVEFETIKDMINSLPTIIKAEVSE